MNWFLPGQKKPLLYYPSDESGPVLTFADDNRRYFTWDEASTSLVEYGTTAARKHNHGMAVAVLADLLPSCQSLLG